MNDCAADFTEMFAVYTFVDILDNIVNLSVVVIVILRHITASFKLVYLGGAHTEDENVVFTDCIVNFNICTVHCAEGDCTVNHKFHITGTACFCTCK